MPASASSPGSWTYVPPLAGEHSYAFFTSRKLSFPTSPDFARPLTAHHVRLRWRRRREHVAYLRLSHLTHYESQPVPRAAVATCVRDYPARGDGLLPSRPQRLGPRSSVDASRRSNSSSSSKRPAVARRAPNSAPDVASLLGRLYSSAVAITCISVYRLAHGHLPGRGVFRVYCPTLAVPWLARFVLPHSQAGCLLADSVPWQALFRLPRGFRLACLHVPPTLLYRSDAVCLRVSPAQRGPRVTPWLRYARPGVWLCCARYACFRSRHAS